MIKLFFKNNYAIIKNKLSIYILLVTLSIIFYICPSVVSSLLKHTKINYNFLSKMIIYFLPINLSMATSVSCPKYMFIAPTSLYFRKKYVITSLIFKISSIFIINIVLYLIIVKNSCFSYINIIFYISYLLIHLISFNLSMGGYNVSRYKEINYCNANKLKYSKYYYPSLHSSLIIFPTMFMLILYMPDIYSRINISIYLHIFTLVIFIILLLTYLIKNYQTFIKSTTSYDILFFNLD